MAVNVIHGSYGGLLWDKRWREKRARILSRDNNCCVNCGSTKDLTVHHKQYHLTPNGRKFAPWAYDDKYLITLCKKCHRAGHNKYKVPAFVITNIKTIQNELV